MRGLEITENHVDTQRSTVYTATLVYVPLDKEFIDALNDALDTADPRSSLHGVIGRHHAKVTACQAIDDLTLASLAGDRHEHFRDAFARALAYGLAEEIRGQIEPDVTAFVSAAKDSK